MQNVGVRIEGGRALRATLKAAGSDLSELRDAHKRSATIAASAAAPLAPFRTGALRASVRASGTKTSGIIRAGTARVPYAKPIHWGWPARKITPTPFLSHGAQASEPVWITVYERAVDDALGKVHGT